MNNKNIKTTINIPKEKRDIIDAYVATLPFTNRSQFMIDCALEAIQNANTLPLKTKSNIIPHVTELSNLVNELTDVEQKVAIQKEVMCIWQSLN